MQIYTIFWSLTQKKVRLSRIYGSGGKLKKKYVVTSLNYLPVAEMLAFTVREGCVSAVASAGWMVVWEVLFSNNEALRSRVIVVWTTGLPDIFDEELDARSTDDGLGSRVELVLEPSACDKKPSKLS